MDHLLNLSQHDLSVQFSTIQTEVFEAVYQGDDIFTRANAFMLNLPSALADVRTIIDTKLTSHAYTKGKVIAEIISNLKNDELVSTPELWIAFCLTAILHTSEIWNKAFSDEHGSKLHHEILLFYNEVLTCTYFFNLQDTEVFKNWSQNRKH